MLDRETKVIGYFAYLSPGQVVCTDVDACVVSGSSRAMQEYLAEIDPDGAHKATVKKTRFGEIARGLQLRAADGVDQESTGGSIRWPWTLVFASRRQILRGNAT